ncbi:MAG TPA: hypothetical protein VG711_10315, partial [Phycisphaerales bacterium]|nr:hypothetical protein [Phycisphaerales bacterium]
SLQQRVNDGQNHSVLRTAEDRVLRVTAEVERPLWSWLGSLSGMRFLVVQRSHTETRARVFAGRGGWIERFADVPMTSNAKELGDLSARVTERLDAIPDSRDSVVLENVCVLTHHLFAPKASRSGSFLRMTGDHNADAKAVASALRRLAKEGSKEDSSEDPSAQSAMQ